MLKLNSLTEKIVWLSVIGSTSVKTQKYQWNAMDTFILNDIEWVKMALPKNLEPHYKKTGSLCFAELTNSLECLYTSPVFIRNINI